ncbi:CDP-diacylglycerol--glycerol-3-phosphate 3-phosphatidyltransferase [Botrimarina colliarenosi]|uniref:CDP-diacylglycerol--glycerol-3-phosphate 3-phosphatidyltransferase n=1 Tax=Botrimarina colliarenosi TaxID=2528001 RepID=A0A5C6A8W3_9BACT|nr:CDP-diacylglycerol--glycerol-3-phosphate 3-phosphatidyltransferase [Botrimarina colliarenosi]TWT95810.1 CDP-diacylglycerol--glycerol-3-phosphate 3-phosphatidyltransferase [Botrimarina colliarenosi]
MPRNSEVPLGKLSDPPNAITASRLAVTVACFVFLSLGWYRVGLIAFVLAAATDWADGYWARRWGPITRLGRVLDPLADKLLICGTFTYLAAIPDSRIVPWMAVVVLGREFLVTTLRAFVESSGGDFSAVWIGKWKFVLQVIAAALSLLYISPWRTVNWFTSLTLSPQWSDLQLTVTLQPGLVDAAVWAMVALTVLSGITYTRSAIAAMRSDPPHQD